MSEPRKTKKASPGKVLGSLAAVTLVGVAGVVGTTAALSDTTSNDANEFDAAYLELNDNDSGTYLYDVTDQEPGDLVERCIQISYVSSRDGDVSLFTNSTVDTLAPYLNLTIEAGTQASPSFAGCTGFTADGAPIYDGDLDDFATTHNSAATGVAYSPNDPGQWVDGDLVVYKVTVELDPGAGSRPDGANYSGLHDYVWQADTA